MELFELEWYHKLGIIVVVAFLEFVTVLLNELPWYHWLGVVAFFYLAFGFIMALDLKLNSWRTRHTLGDDIGLKEFLVIGFTIIPRLWGVTGMTIFVFGATMTYNLMINA